MGVTKQKLIASLLLTSLVLPLSIMADSSAPLCANQPYQTLLKTCLQPGGSAQSVITACSAIIKNNCLSLDSTSPTLQLAAIHQAMVTAYAANPGSVPPPPPPSPDSATNPNAQASRNAADAPVIHHFVQASKYAPKPQKLKQPTPKSQSTNFWF
jgi:hypothetical protein